MKITSNNRGRFSIVFTLVMTLLSAIVWYGGKALAKWLFLFLLIAAYSIEICSGGTLQLRNDGSCTATNGRWNYVVVAQSGIVGKFSDVGGAFTTVAPGGLNNIQTWSMTGAQSVTVALWVTDGTDITPRYQGQYTTVGTNNTVFSYMPRTCSTNTQAKTFAATLNNTASMTQRATWKKDGVVVFSIYLSPGQSYTYTYTWNSPPDPSLSWGMTALATTILNNDGNFDIKTVGQTNDYTFNLGTGGTNQGNTGSNTFDSQTNTFWPVYGDMPNWNATSLTNPGAINWNNPDSTAARDATLKAGFNKIASQLDSVINGEAMIKEAIENAPNSAGETGVVAAVESFHRDMTNRWDTNLTVSASSTNASSAQTKAAEFIAETETAATGIETAIGSAPEILTGGSPAGLTIEFAGQTLNLDPAVRFPGSGELVKGLIMLVVSLSLGKYLSELYFKTVATYATSETGGVPALGPWGAVGAVLAVIVAGAIIVLWIVVFTKIFGYITEHVSALVSSTGGVTLGNAGALYLLNYFFPLSFMLSAAWTRIIAPFGMAKVIMVTSSAQRFLMGK